MLLSIVILLFSILISLTLHEVMHAYAGYWLGDDTAYHQGRLSLNPLKHIDIFTTILLPVILMSMGLPPFGAAKPVPFNPNKVKFGEFGVALVGIAGPVTNLVLALVVGLSWRIFSSDSIAVFHVMQMFVLVNISFFVFNMIPMPPLDGSRVLYALVPESVQDVMHKIESAGFMVILIFMFLIFPLISPRIALLVESLVGLIMGV